MKDRINTLVLAHGRHVVALKEYHAVWEKYLRNKQKANKGIWDLSNNGLTAREIKTKFNKTPEGRLAKRSKTALEEIFNEVHEILKEQNPNQTAMDTSLYLAKQWEGILAKEWKDLLAYPNKTPSHAMSMR
tara:strand:+ start:147 stop:539 length:393 start_codon:yes stop_codon:yes gene_type:complete